ncbi:helix-turn-helix transcriptional regulator [Bradyrhizobium sp. CIAT3101]|uniref:helix-turn-helix domain-containing protein n=1 Tax=Bradyrhizobium sp. CIAT3101 TaxID=439387 RepID=UPI0024B22069|nr:helix-turn-helix transcriptional regulator [Bradyrhizobium sp. CIAT3101]WFU82124.1 helix-turn-helix transcriptional regulator [Bradyrhizobium sp. CIAT3101]
MPSVAPDPLLKELGLRFRKARKAAGLSQEQIALRANISRPRYRDIETGAAAARATTLVNVARALGMEMMLIPQAMVPAIQSMLQPANADDDRPAFTSDVEEEEGS